MNQNRNARCIVIGSSAGGMQALTKLVSQFPKDFPAAVFIVNHMSADTTGGVLVKALNESSNLACAHARDGQSFKSGQMYLAPSDQHMLIVKEKTLVTKGGPGKPIAPCD